MLLTSVSAVLTHLRYSTLINNSKINTTTISKYADRNLANATRITEVKSKVTIPSTSTQNQHHGSKAVVMTCLSIGQSVIELYQT